MENETSKSVWLAVTMVIITLVVAAISFTLILGRDLANGFTSRLEAVLGVRSTDMPELEGQIKVTSAANAQMLVSLNSGYIDKDNSKLKVVLHGDGAHTNLGDITTIAHGNVIMEVRKEGGLYKVILHRDNCNIGKLHGTCNCNSMN